MGKRGWPRGVPSTRKVIGGQSTVVGGAIEIQLTKGNVAFVDPQDAEIDDGCWYTLGAGPVYAGHAQYGAKRGKSLSMHRLVMRRIIGGELPDGAEVDHINHNGLDNRRENLRLTDRSGNLRNRIGWGKYPKGVHLDKVSGKYRAVLHLGLFDSPEEAGAAWKNATEELGLIG